jgi:hypothetical protein
MADPIPTPQAAQAAAALRNKQQLDGIKAAAVKAGRQLERRDMCPARR